MEATYSQAVPLCQRLRDGEQKQQLSTEFMQPNEGATQPGIPFAFFHSMILYIHIQEHMHITKFLNIKVLYFF